METKFENRFVRTKELTKEIYSYFYFKRPLTVALFILAWIVFILHVILLILDGSYMLMGILLAPIFTLLQLLLYTQQISVTEKREKEMYDGNISVVCLVTDECIINTASTGAESRLEYKNIAGVVQTKNLILLRTKAKVLYIFDKNGFVVGTKEEFLDFLKGKMAKS